MIASIVGNYLMDVGLLTEEQLHDLLVEHRRVRAKLGMIAVAEGLMTEQEADRVNRLQAIMDMRFGDIAVEEGYLTEGQVETLLKKQGSTYLAFVQAMENQKLMKLDLLEQLLIDFQYDNNLTASDMETLKGDDIDRIIELFLPLVGKKYEQIASIALRTIMRLVDQDVHISKAYLTKQKTAQNGAFQQVEGKKGFTCGMFGSGIALCPAASVFGQEYFGTADEDALDAIGELINCINGLAVTSFDSRDGSLELCPPEYYCEMEKITAEEMLVMPLRILGKKVDFIIALNHQVTVE